MKAFGVKLFQGAAGWKVYALVAAGGVALVVWVLVWFSGRIDEAHAAGEKAVKVEQLSSDLAALKKVVDAERVTNDAIAENLARLGGMGERVAELERVRRADAARIDRLVRAAPEGAVRAHAEQAERDLAEVERSRDGFAEEAVRASTAAWGYRDSLQARREAIAAERRRPVSESAESGVQPKE